MHILVTGGAGYIGSHTAKQLAMAGHVPVILDNLLAGHRWAVRWGPFVNADLSDRTALDEAFTTFPIEAVIHLAAFASVGNSVRRPAEYFQNNVANSFTLLDAMQRHRVKYFVFSSSCATYGNALSVPLVEGHPQQPVSPYGESKLMVERLLPWYERAYGLRWMILRYFNAAGADADGDLGEVHRPETHLIPRAISVAHGESRALRILGTNYDTLDGTAIRDYVHVMDLADAHLRALTHLARGAKSAAFNLGSGCGYSVRQVVQAVEAVAGRSVKVSGRPRRPGDPPVLIADPSQAREVLGWTPKYSSLEFIVRTAFLWQTSQFARRAVGSGNA
jgi:UDP-glucose-4-epimerase GalE